MKKLITTFFVLLLATLLCEGQSSNRALFPGMGKKGANEQEAEKITSIKEFVEGGGSGVFIVKGHYVKTYNFSDLLLSIEDEDYIIPIKLVKKDLGAEKRFRSLDLKPGDTLTIEGIASSIDVKLDSYRGLIDATIVEKREAVQKESDSFDDEQSNAVPFQIVEEKPTFNGGDANEFSKWVNAHLNYPVIAKTNGVQGRVTLQFTVEADGRVTKVRVLRGVEESLDKEAVRVVSKSPRWKPGRMKGEAVSVTYIFPVIFQMR